MGGLEEGKEGGRKEGKDRKMEDQLGTFCSSLFQCLSECGLKMSSVSII